MESIELFFHTDSPTIRDLCVRYWARDVHGKFLFKISVIAEALDISAWQVPAFVEEHCRAYDSNESCSICYSQRPFANRTDFLNRRHVRVPGSWICSACVDSQRRRNEQKIQLEAKSRFDAIKLELENKINKSLFAYAVSFKNLVYLVSLLRAYGSQDLSYIEPIEFISSPPLSPSVERDDEIVSHLYDSGLICVHPGSRKESVQVIDGEFTSFYRKKVHWILPISQGGPTPMSLLEELERQLRQQSLRAEWRVDADRIHREIALEECLQYLKVVMREHGFEPPVGEKTQSVLRAALRNFSIGQSYSFIWRAAKDAASFYLRSRTSKTHAANIVPGAIQRMAERAIAQGWQTSSFRRDFRTPVSVISHVLFTLVLNLPDDGFTTVPPTDDGVSSSIRSEAAEPVDWKKVRNRLEEVLYGDQPLTERYDAIYKELQALKRDDALFSVRMELDSMARSAQGNRERPFLQVGEDLLTFCDSQGLRDLETRGKNRR